MREHRVYFKQYIQSSDEDWHAKLWSTRKDRQEEMSTGVVTYLKMINLQFILVIGEFVQKIRSDNIENLER